MKNNDNFLLNLKEDLKRNYSSNNMNHSKHKLNIVNKKNNFLNSISPYVDSNSYRTKGYDESNKNVKNNMYKSQYLNLINHDMGL